MGVGRWEFCRVGSAHHLEFRQSPANKYLYLATLVLPQTRLLREVGFVFDDAGVPLIKIVDSQKWGVDRYSISTAEVKSQIVDPLRSNTFI